MSELVGDLKVSLRQLARAPGFTAAAIGVLALGIGLNAAMFSLVYAFAFTGRPFEAPERVVQLYSSQTREPDSYRAFSYPAYQALAARDDLFSGVLAHSPTIVGVSSGGDARRTFAVAVSRNYFDVLGVGVIRGRGFTEDEDRPASDIPVMIATYGFWQRTGFDPGLVGSTLRINGRAFTVVGITPRGFTGTMMVFGPELFFPLGVFHSIANDFEGDTARTLGRVDVYNLFLVARLETGVSVETAAGRLALAARDLERSYPAEYQDARLTLAGLPRFGISTSPSDEGGVGLLGAVMLGLTGAVLLTVCLNLAAMLMARGRARRKEFAIRLALGGGRLRIVRQLLVEGLLLSIAGGAAGVVLGLVGIDTLVSAFAALLPVTIVLGDAVSPALLLATVVFCLLATSWFALVPALRHSRADVIGDLKPNASDDAATKRRRFMPRSPLVVAQVALSLALLIAAGLFVRMAQAALSVDFGFAADRTVVVEVDSKLAGATTPQTIALYAQIERRLAALPGAESTGIGAIVPLGMITLSRSVRRAGLVVPDDARPATAEEGRAFDSPWNAVSSGYFAAMGIPLLHGRPFTEGESFDVAARPVAILDDTLARKLWPDGSAVGQRVQFTNRRGSLEPQHVYEVVGVVGSTHRHLFESELPGAVYVPFAQGGLGNAFFHVRPAATAGGLVDAVRHEIRSAAPDLPLFSARTFGAHVRSSIEYWALRLAAALFATFGIGAMIVALVGLYGVMSYAVARRTREIGIRMAVGAMPGTVRRMILGESLSVTLLGVGLGWLLGIGVGRVLASVFVDLSAFDPLTFTVVPIAFVASSIVAAWLPAERATRVDPTIAIRSE